MYRHGKGVLWIFTLAATNEIPSVVVMFVALIMFVQMGVGMSMATAYSAMLLLPRAAQPLMRHFLPRTEGGVADLRLLRWTEGITVVVMAFFALLMDGDPLRTFGMLMCMSMLSSWHDVLACRYSTGRICRVHGRWQSVVRIVSSQVFTVLTYGLMIMAVGVLEIYFRQRAMWYSWALCCYILTGVYMLMAMANILFLDSSPVVSRQSVVPLQRRRQWMLQAVLLALLLLPQGLMFFCRTIFLLSRPQQGGLGCTLQEVGFAQGTVGVIAFLLGVTLGRQLQRTLGEAVLELPLIMCLGLSPLVYLVMTQCPPDGLPLLSVYTFVAQLLFGLGLNGCQRRIAYISGDRYRNAVNPVTIPIISLCLFLPMAASGYMAERLSFSVFFLLDTLCAPVAWLAVAVVSWYHKPAIS